MGALDGRVAIITGAGRGIGREHALLFASEGAKVVVNDLGGATDGSGSDKTAAEQVVAEIEAMGGQAVANGDSVTDWDGAQRLVAAAVEAFGDLHVLVNNAGILRDRFSFNMSEEEWDAVVAVHMKGHFCPTRMAAAYWRDQTKAGKTVNAAIVNTTSAAGLLGNAGQLNYTAAKAGIAGMTMVEAMELGRYGVRANCIAPVARTRLTLQTPGLGDNVAAPEDAAEFDALDPANISPLVAYLATADCPFTGGVFHVMGDEVALFEGWSVTNRIKNDGERWSVAGLAAEGKRLLEGRPAFASQGTDMTDLIGGMLGSN
ncbi:MAG TPA: SDR family oxidoreductase [Acidimicrobiales bacterium]|nr:SDR family oxidoreductase [Acidimicrobiales bacterium]